MQIYGKNITAVASDIDGTILNGTDSLLRPEVLCCVRALVDAGIIFVAASGRQYENMAKLFAPVKNDIYFVCENGSIVVHRDKILWKVCIEETTARELIRDIRRYYGNINTIVSSGGSVYGERCNEDFINYVNTEREQCFRLVEDFSLITDAKNKISVVFPDGDVSHGELLREKYSSRLSVVDAGGGWLDFTSKASGKGTGLKYLKDNVLPAGTAFACFGDSENDVSMFSVAELSFAMPHSSDFVKSSAGRVCTDVVELLTASL